LKSVSDNSNVQPTDWFFGHHHDHSMWHIDAVNYYCCGKHSESWLYSETECVKQGQRTVQ
jgi:hypothetical protein